MRRNHTFCLCGLGWLFVHKTQKKRAMPAFFVVNFLKLFLLNFFVGFHFASSFGAAAFHAILLVFPISRLHTWLGNFKAFFFLGSVYHIFHFF